MYHYFYFQRGSFGWHVRLKLRMEDVESMCELISNYESGWIYAGSCGNCTQYMYSNGKNMRKEIANG